MVAPGHNALDIPLTTMCWTSASDSCIMYIDDEGRAFITTHTDRENIMNFPTPTHAFGFDNFFTAKDFHQLPVCHLFDDMVEKGEMHRPTEEERERMRDWDETARANYVFDAEMALFGELFKGLDHVLTIRRSHIPRAFASSDGVRFDEPKYNIDLWVREAEDRVGEPTNYVQTASVDFTRAGTCIYIYTLRVNEAYNRRGIGKDLMTLVHSFAEDLDVSHVVLLPCPDPRYKGGPKSLTAWYKKQGYRSFVPSWRVPKLVAEAMKDAEYQGPAARQNTRLQVTKWTRSLLAKRVGKGMPHKLTRQAIMVVGGAFRGDMEKWQATKPEASLEEAVTQVKDAACYAR